MVDTLGMASTQDQAADGPSASPAEPFLKILEKLVGSDEKQVSQAAATSFNLLIQSAVKGGNAGLLKALWESAQRLAKDNWMALRQAAPEIIAVFIEHQQFVDESSALILDLCLDNTSIVRRHAIPFLAKLPQAAYDEEKRRIVSKLLEDPQDLVRLYAVPILWSLLDNKDSQKEKEGSKSDASGGKGAEKEKASSSADLSVAPTKAYLIKQFALDQSWRVRYMLADTIAIGVPSINAANVDTLMMYLGLLMDQEGEVRACATKRLADFCNAIAHLRDPSQSEAQNSAITKSTILRLLGHLNALAVDTYQSVRAALADALPGLALLLSLDDTRTEVIPLIMRLLKDDSSEVRLACIAQLDVLIRVAGMETIMETLVPALTELSVDSNWRVRQTTVHHISLLAEHFPSDRFDVNLLHPILTKALVDPVWSVRENTCHVLSKLYHSLWQKETLLPILQNNSNASSYLMRLTVLSLIEKCPNPCFLGILHKLATDKIANVRMAASRAALHILPKIQDEATPETKDAIIQLENVLTALKDHDDDSEVRMFAEQAVRLICFAT